MSGPHPHSGGNQDARPVGPLTVSRNVVTSNYIFEGIILMAENQNLVVPVWSVLGGGIPTYFSSLLVHPPSFGPVLPYQPSYRYNPLWRHRLWSLCHQHPTDIRLLTPHHHRRAILQVQLRLHPSPGFLELTRTAHHRRRQYSLSIPCMGTSTLTGLAGQPQARQRMVIGSPEMPPAYK